MMDTTLLYTSRMRVSTQPFSGFDISHIRERIFIILVGGASKMKQASEAHHRRSDSRFRDRIPDPLDYPNAY